MSSRAEKRRAAELLDLAIDEAFAIHHGVATIDELRPTVRDLLGPSRAVRRLCEEDGLTYRIRNRMRRRVRGAPQFAPSVQALGRQFFVAFTLLDEYGFDNVVRARRALSDAAQERALQFIVEQVRRFGRKAA